MFIPAGLPLSSLPLTKYTMVPLSVPQLEEDIHSKTLQGKAIITWETEERIAYRSYLSTSLASDLTILDPRLSLITKTAALIDFSHASVLTNLSS